MINYINGKINGTPYLTSAKEQGEYYTLLSNSLLSQGSMTLAPRLKVGNRIVWLGKNAHHLGILLMELKSDTCMIDKQIIKSVDLWKLFKKIIYEIFPAAQAEALSKSKELPKKEISTDGYDYTKGDAENK